MSNPRQTIRKKKAPTDNGASEPVPKKTKEPEASEPAAKEPVAAKETSSSEPSSSAKIRDAKELPLPPNLPPCDSEIWGHGPLLDSVMRARVFEDSKTFVDKKLRHSPGKIIKRFEELIKENQGKELTKEQIQEVNICSISYLSCFYI